MIKNMKKVAFAALLFTLLFLLLNTFIPCSVFTALAITAGTITYHFAIRLIIGYTIDGIFTNRINHNNFWFRQKSFEEGLYSFLKVKKWKSKMPTAVPENFDLKTNNPKQVLGAMCQAEIVHKINIIASFLPIASVPWFGSFWVFFITSLLSACYDSVFVIMQRYNRPRILKISEKLKVRSV